MAILEIMMVRLQGDFAKPPEKRLNYKNCIDGLFRVRYRVVDVAYTECLTDLGALFLARV